MHRRLFLQQLSTSAALAVSTGTSSSASPPRHQSETTLAELRQQLAAGRTTSQRLVRQCLRLIQDLDVRGPRLRAVLRINPDALALAAELDRELASGRSRGLLHGLPILLKDNLDTADRQPTTAGSLALADAVAPGDATVTRRLRQAGAVILGKANLSEWANFRSTRSVSGWSAVGGQTRNPYVLTRNPSGSSSGSAAAVAAGLAPAAIGTETNGSIVSPACHNSLVGLKPTVGLISRSGIIPISASQDTAGPMTRTVADAALLLGVIAGPDANDPATAEAERQARPDYLRFLDRDALRGRRLGIARDRVGSHPGVKRVFEAQLKILRDLGAELVDPVALPTWGRLWQSSEIVMLHEFKDGVARYLATRGDSVPVRSLADLIAFNQAQADREMPYFEQELFLKSNACGPLTSAVYQQALDACRRLARAEGLDAVIREHRLDALVAPTESALAWLIDPVNGDCSGGDSCSTLPAVAGYPHLTVPAGYVNELPVGLSFFGGAWSEPDLLAMGYAYEQATRHRRPPRFLPG